MLGRHLENKIKVSPCSGAQASPAPQNSCEFSFGKLAPHRYNQAMQIISWNVNGIRSIAKKNFRAWLSDCGADIVCLQEIRAHETQWPQELLQVEGCKLEIKMSERKGYSGVAIYSRVAPLRVLRDFDFDREGRILGLEFPDFYLFNVYFPNGKMSEERLNYKLDFYEKFLQYCEKLRQKKSVIFCGDVNTAHKAIDLARPKENEKISGFMPIERKWLDKIVRAGYVDAFREFDQSAEKYTWWSQRAGARKRNVGWRIDYFFVNREFLSHVKNCEIHPQVMGSDHCPVSLTLA